MEIKDWHTLKVPVISQIYQHAQQGFASTFEM